MLWTNLSPGCDAVELRPRGDVVQGCLVRTTYQGDDWVETSLCWLPGVKLETLQMAGEPREWDK
jgi:hypothetical protein